MKYAHALTLLYHLDVVKEMRRFVPGSASFITQKNEVCSVWPVGWRQSISIPII